MSVAAQDMPASAGARIGLTDDALVRISEAVRAAEQKTSAEIRVVVTRMPLVQHPFFSVLWASLLALVVPWLVVLARPMPALSILSMQAALFVVLAAALMLPGIAPRVVPRLALKAAARSAAVETFLSYGIPQTAGRTGLLIFAAVHERMVEVVADEAAHTPLGHAAWAEICEAVAARARQGNLGDGLIAGVSLAGDLLAGPLPRQPGDRDELPNQVVIL
ncbi:hypothetical protein V5F49_18755 [Xanthobacter sp. V3C-3]|uniref:TPM domain-containing protein n=1 Tax=Xanthobacter lutulentifluminis TaxID=3119935 RepID=UPI003729D701